MLMTDRQTSELLDSLPANISDVLGPWAKSSPDKLALVEPAGTWTYAQLDAAVAETRVWLRDSGVRSGDRVMLVCENCRAFVAIFLALTAMDAWPVLANARLSAREVDDIPDHRWARRVSFIGPPSHPTPRNTASPTPLSLKKGQVWVLSASPT